MTLTLPRRRSPFGPRFCRILSSLVKCSRYNGPVYRSVIYACLAIVLRPSPSLSRSQGTLLHKLRGRRPRKFRRGAGLLSLPKRRRARWLYRNPSQRPMPGTNSNSTFTKGLH